MTELTSTVPLHEVNGYSAWSLPSRERLPFDQLWINIAGSNPRGHRVLPTGEPSIAVRRTRNFEGEVTNCEIVVCCQYTISCWHLPPPNEELIALRLKPELASFALGISPVEYIDAAPLPVPKQMFCKLSRTRRAAEEGEPAQLVAKILVDELIALWDEVVYQKEFVIAAALLRETDGAIPVRKLAAALNVSTRTLQRRFVDHLGVTPKFYSRRLRLTRAAIIADHSEQLIWADIAASCGFHDQAHLINEYKQLIGLTPTASRTERLGLSDFSNS